ncbi:hypothetical protein ACJJTC_004671 [Scirpophaga incertulas]
MCFKIYFQNSRSIRGKLVEFSQGLLMHDFHIVAVCETWLLDSVGDAEVSDSRYDVHRRDRPCSGGVVSRGGRVRAVGGGAMLLTLRSLAARALPTPQDFTFDMVHVVIQARTLRAPRDLHVICVYLPGSGAAHNDMVINFPNVEWKLDPDNSRILIPFNVAGEALSAFFQTTSLFGFNQYNTVINDNNRYLDLFFSTLDLAASRCTLPITREDMPHHPAIEIEILNLQSLNMLRDGTKNIVRSFKKADYVGIKTSLSSIDWSTNLKTGSVDDCVAYFYRELWSIIESKVPSFLSNGQGYPIWYSKALISIIKEKDKYHKLWKKFKNPLDYNTFSLLRLRQKQVQQECWKRYVSSCEDALKTNPKHFWSYTNSLRKDRGIPAQMTYRDQVAGGGSDMCNLFQDYFSSNPEADDKTARKRSISGKLLDYLRRRFDPKPGERFCQSF